MVLAHHPTTYHAHPSWEGAGMNGTGCVVLRACYFCIGDWRVQSSPLSTERSGAWQSGEGKRNSSRAAWRDLYRMARC